MTGQLLTIPEALSRAGKSLSGGPTVPSGLPPTIDQVLATTDIIARGVLGEPSSYLSDDRMDVYTDYPLQSAEILYQDAHEPTRPRIAQASTITVTMLGGAITINGLTFTSKHDALPLLTRGTECLLLLKQLDGHYFIAGDYYGAFRITNGKLVRLTHKEGFAPELNGVAVTQVAQTLVSRLGSIRRNR